MKLRICLVVLFTLTAFFLLVKRVFASEGTIEMRSVTEEPYRCWASSVRMQNLEYRIPFTCTYLIYPADENIFNYVVWARPTDGSSDVKLGTLGLGKGEFKTKKSFGSLFVTIEGKKETKTPQGTTVMEGEVEPITFLKEGLSPTPTVSTEETPAEEQAQTKPLTTKEKLFLALRRAGIAALVALVALIGLIFVVTRSRG